MSSAPSFRWMPARSKSAPASSRLTCRGPRPRWIADSHGGSRAPWLPSHLLGGGGPDGPRAWLGGPR
eukprot:2441889-Pyramimonas_sp.AAC.1